MSNGFELQTSSLRRWLTDWFRARWRELRGQNSVTLDWEQPLEAAPLFLDSLEILSLASHAADDFCVRDSGIEDYFLARRTLAEWEDLIRQSWARSSNPSVSFSTSGSTGTPVHHRHLLAHLNQEIEAFQAILPPSPTIRKSVPSHHIYGFLFTVLLADRRSAKVVELEPESPRVEPGDLLVSHPVHLNLWKQRGLVLGRGVNILSSTSALSPELWAWLDDQGCRVWEIFGSSETGGIGYRTSGTAPFTLLPYWSLDSDTDLPRLSRPGLPAPLELPDRLDRVSETEFRPGGRRDQGLKIAGRLVYPGAVRQVLLGHPDVEDCALRTEQVAGVTRLAAFVVTQREGPVLEPQLRQWAAERLETGARPQRYAFGPRLPEKLPGQPMDW